VPGGVDSSTTAARRLVTVIEERLALAIPVAAAKRVTGSAIDDPEREAQAADAFVTQVRPAIDTATAKLAESYVQAREVAAADPAAWRSAIARQMRSPGGEWRWQRDSVRTALRPTLVLGRG